MVIMAQDVPNSHYLPPGDFWSFGPQRRGNPARGFGDDLDCALNDVARASPQRMSPMSFPT
jgi:hypothetical protein